MVMADKLFVDGMIVKRKENAPSFVKCSLAFRCKDFHQFMQKNHNDGWLNVDLKVSKNGKLYAEVDTWKPNKAESNDWGEPPVGEDTRDFSDGNPDDIPF